MQDYYENPWIGVEFASSTYYLSSLEENYNNWYKDDVWNDFIEKRNALFESFGNIDDYRYVDYTDYTEAEEKLISEKFYDLLYSYNKMTCKDAVMGDVNNDGEINIDDVTLIRKYLVDRVDFTGGQMLRAAVWSPCCYEIDINCSTVLQKYLVNDNQELFNQIIPEEKFSTEFNEMICMQNLVDPRYDNMYSIN